MDRLILLIALAACACGRHEPQNAAVPEQSAADPAAVSQGPISKPAAVVPMPKDQAQLDRMILAGYTPHGKHLHPPGVKECPFAQGTEAVM